MSKTKTQARRNETKRLLDRSFNTKEQVIKINTSNTIEHELAKFLLAWEAACDGKRFVTEAIFSNGKRADILVLDDGEAWEVLKSETKEKFKLKLDEYPCPIIPFQAQDVIEHWKKKLFHIPEVENDN